MAVHDHAEVAAHEDQVDAVVRPAAVAVAGQRLPVGTVDRERDVRRPARPGDDVRREAGHPVAARRLDGDRADGRAPAAAAREQDAGEDDPRTVQEMKALACCALAAAAGLVPTPVGEGPRYRPPPRTDGFACRPAPIVGGARIHLELFAKRRVVVVPAALGLGAPTFRYGRVVRAACRGEAWTTDPAGVVHVDGARTLGLVFAVWGQPLGPGRLASFAGRVSVWVNGSRRRTDPRRLVLHDRDEVVLEVGGYVPPHRTFRFPPH
jgi:hypothetical protein